MPTFFHRKKQKTVKAYSLQQCPKPIEDWTDEKPDYSKLDNQTKIEGDQ